MVFGVLKTRWQNYKVKSRFERLLELSRLSLTFNDTSEEIIKATETLINLSHNPKRFIELILYLIDTLDVKDDLSPQLIAHVSEICALPNIDTLKKLTQNIILKYNKAKDKDEASRIRGNGSIVWGIYAEKLAGKVSEGLFDEELAKTLISNLDKEYDLITHLYTFICLENFSLTNNNKTILLNTNYTQKLKDYLKELDKKESLSHQLEFCLKNSKVDFLNEPLLSKEILQKEFEGVHCTLDWTISASFLKYSNDLSEVRNDRMAFATALGTTCINDGKWYYEVLLITGGIMQIGWATQSAIFKPEEGIGIGDEIHSFGYDGLRNLAWYKGESVTYGIQSWKAGDVIGVYLDLEKGFGNYTLNGAELGGDYYFEPGDIQLFCETEGGLRPGISLTSYQQVIVNFGTRPFKYPPPHLSFQLINDFGQLTTQLKLGPKYQLKELMKEENEEEMKKLCQICYLNEGKLELIPCHHDKVCIECVNRMDACPFCRQSISSWLVKK